MLKEQAYKPNFVPARKRVTIIHLGRRLPDGSSDLPGNAAMPEHRLERATQKRFPIWSCTTRSLPGLDCYQPSRWALTPPFHPSPLFTEAGLFSVALVVTGLDRCPDVIRLAALRCSDFPLLEIEKRPSGLLLLHGSRSIAKNVEH